MKKPPAPRKRVKKSDVDPRTRILDAAEQLFAERGFYGVSMRDIALVAAVVPSHLVYNFETKENLYAEVFLRRVHELTAARLDRLHHATHATQATQATQPAQATQSTQAAGDAEAILRAYVSPLLQRRTSGDAGWRSYTRLVGQFANTSLPFATRGAMQKVFQVVDESGLAFMKELRRAVPGLSKRDAIHGFLFFVASMLNMFAETGRIEALSAGSETSAELEPQCAALVRFCAGGLRALAARPRAA